MLVEELLQLPPWIDYEGIHFQLSLFSNGPELRLAYVISHADHDSPHKSNVDRFGCWVNKVADPDDPPNQGFLQLYEGIQSDADLCFAARSMWHWLIEKGFHKFVFHKKDHHDKDQ